MKNQKSTLLLIICCLSTCIVTAQQHVETIKNTFLNPKSNKVLVVAHRGNWRSAPENSTAAIDSAIAMKVDIVEIDIQKTKDGQLILMHDNTLDRTTTGKGEIKNWTLADIKKLKLKDKDGKVCAAITVKLEPKKDEKTGRLSMVPIEGTQKEIPVDLVLIAAGFLGSEGYVAESFGVKLNARTNVETVNGSYRTGKEKIFTAGDMHRGQSLVVWAIAEGREAAKEVDKSLMGYTYE